MIAKKELICLQGSKLSWKVELNSISNYTRNMWYLRMSWLKQKPKEKLSGILRWMRSSCWRETSITKKIITKHLEEKNRQLEHHNQMIDTDNNQLNRSNMLLSENISNMDEQIDRASVYTKRICLNTRQVERDLHWYQ